MNAFLDEEQTLLQNQVRRWLDENVSPLIDRHEAAKTFPFEILSDLAQFGYLGGRIPEADGGYDLPYVTWGMLMERAGYCWGSLRTILNITNGTIQKLSTHGTEEQKARWLKPILANQLKVCTGLSEPNVGSNVRGIETRAVWKGDHYVLSGRKLWITNGVNADIAQIVARVSGSPECEDGKLSTFIVERGMKGYSARPVEKMVLRCTGTAARCWTRRFDTSSWCGRSARISGASFGAAWMCRSSNTSLPGSPMAWTRKSHSNQW